MSARIQRYSGRLVSMGFLGTSLFLMRSLLIHALNGVENFILKLERFKCRTSEESLSSHLNTRQDNFKKWDPVDWSRVGDEWTQDAHIFKNLDSEQWKKNLLDKFLFSHIPENGAILEVGPGGGRWTQELAKKTELPLYLADVSESSLRVCKDLLKNKSRVFYHQVKPEDSSPLPPQYIEDSSITFIWSYDVFVHINPYDIEKYIKEFYRILQPGSYGVIHHAGRYPSENFRRKYFRSNMDDRFFRYLLKKYKLTVVSQDFEAPHFPGDVITIFCR